MAFNGSGTFSRTTGTYTGATAWAQEAAAGNDIEAAKFDTHDQDIATGLSNCICKDGQTTITANLPMAGFKHTGVGDGTARNHYASVGQLQDCSVTYAVSAGSANAQTITLSPAITAYVDGLLIYFKAGTSNTAAATMNVNSVSAASIKHLHGGADVRSGDIVINQYYAIIWSASAGVWYLFNPSFPIYTGLNLSGLSASTLVATDSSKNLTTAVTGMTPTLTGLNLSGLTASLPVVTDGSKNLGSETIGNILNNGLTVGTWSPTITGSGTISISSQTNYDRSYQRIGPFIFFIFSANFTISGTGTTLQIPAPVSGTAHNVNSSFVCVANENGSGVADARWRYDGTNFLVFKAGLGNWTAGANAGIHITSWYLP